MVTRPVFFALIPPKCASFDISHVLLNSLEQHHLGFVALRDIVGKAL
jgi:hypothetical protein